jgi:hypothetical protein
MIDDELKVLVYTQSYGIQYEIPDAIFYDNEHEYDISHIRFVNQAVQKILADIDFSLYKDVKIIVETQEENDINCSPYVQAKFFLKFQNKHDALAFKLRK